jgi:hypothetical protein
MFYAPSENLKVLFIAPYPVLPATTGGKIRIVQLANQLSRMGFDISILAPYKPGQWQCYDDSYGFELREVRYPFLLPVFLLDRPFPYGYLASFHPGYGAKLKQFLDGFDIFQFEHAFFGDFANSLPSGRPVIYDAHNVEFDYVRSECSLSTIRDIVGKRIYRLERDLIQRASSVFVCSNNERQRFTDLYGTRDDQMVVAPNGIKRIQQVSSPNATAALHERFPDLTRFQQYAVYTGSDVEHNRQAVRLIIERIAPQLRAECAFIVHGTVAKAFMNKKYDDNIFFDTSYGGLEPYAIPRAVGLNPVTQGGGTNLKLIQYLAHGIPVVSTEFGMRGYDELKPYVTVSSINEFSNALKSQPTLDPAVLPLLQTYLWEEIAANLSDTYLALCDRSS